MGGKQASRQFEGPTCSAIDSLTRSRGADCGGTGPAIGKVMGSDGHCLGGRGRIDRSSFEGLERTGEGTVDRRDRIDV